MCTRASSSLLLRFVILLLLRRLLVYRNILRGHEVIASLSEIWVFFSRSSSPPHQPATVSWVCLPCSKIESSTSLIYDAITKKNETVVEKYVLVMALRVTIHSGLIIFLNCPFRGKESFFLVRRMSMDFREEWWLMWHMGPLVLLIILENTFNYSSSLTYRFMRLSQIAFIHLWTSPSLPTDIRESHMNMTMLILGDDRDDDIHSEKPKREHQKSWNIKREEKCDGKIKTKSFQLVVNPLLLIKFNL